MDSSKRVRDTYNYMYHIVGPIPYRCREFEVNPDHYIEWSDSEQTEDLLAEKLVLRTILSIAYEGRSEISRTDMTDEETSRVLQTNQSPTKDNRQRSVRNRKQDKRLKKGKREGFEYVTNDSRLYVEPTLSVPMANFRAMVKAEVESRARAVHDFYAYQWQDVQKDRIQTYAELISAKERENNLKDNLKQALDEIYHQQKENERIRIELENIKSAKKKKKKDAKLRRNNDLQGLVETVKDDQEDRQMEEDERDKKEQQTKQLDKKEPETGTTISNIDKDTTQNEAGKFAIESDIQENKGLDSYTPQITTAGESEKDQKDSSSDDKTTGVCGNKTTCTPSEKTAPECAYLEEKLLDSEEPAQGEPAIDIGKLESSEINKQKTENGDKNALQVGDGDGGAKT